MVGAESSARGRDHKVVWPLCHLHELPVPCVFGGGCKCFRLRLRMRVIMSQSYLSMYAVQCVLCHIIYCLLLVFIVTYYCITLTDWGHTHCADCGLMVALVWCQCICLSGSDLFHFQFHQELQHDMQTLLRTFMVEKQYLDKICVIINVYILLFIRKEKYPFNPATSVCLYLEIVCACLTLVTVNDSSSVCSHTLRNPCWWFCLLLI